MLYVSKSRQASLSRAKMRLVVCRDTHKIQCTFSDLPVVDTAAFLQENAEAPVVESDEPRNTRRDTSVDEENEKAEETLAYALCTKTFSNILRSIDKLKYIRVKRTLFHCPRDTGLVVSTLCSEDVTFLYYLPTHTSE